jgi:ADP-ribose pyrophosphatase YjhB (NUDIX family)
LSTVKIKVFAYITHGERLLVFRHPDVPEAGIQVPAGTVREQERLEDAVQREAREETGLDALTVIRYLGERRRDMGDFDRDEIHHRHFFHLRCEGDPPESWQHTERDPADGEPGPILFEFFWVPLAHGLPPLIADHDALVATLRSTLALGVRGRRWSA